MLFKVPIVVGGIKSDTGIYKIHLNCFRANFLNLQKNFEETLKFKTLKLHETVKFNKIFALSLNV